MATKQARELVPGDILRVFDEDVKVTRVEVTGDWVRVHASLDYVNMPAYATVTVVHVNTIGGAL